MSDIKNIKNIVIVGGGTAGWMAAAAFSHVLRKKNCNIFLVESENIGTVGVGEATIPLIQTFNKTLNIDENEFIQYTKGTFKLGIQFVNWGEIGNSYIHPFGVYGMGLGNLSFYHYWLKYHANNRSDDPGEFSIGAQAALLRRFMPPANIEHSPLSKIGYAYHFDAGLYAKYLRNFSEARGVKRVEGEVISVKLNESNGFINSVLLKNGLSVEGDLFVDCTGFRGLLIEQTLKTGWEDWSHWLPCDTAVTVPSENLEPPASFTRSVAHAAGWQWRIPLQHRVGNGHVYASQYMSDDEAKKILLENIAGRCLADPKVIRFKTGMRKKAWHKNCLALGLSSGFLEPLESTSIHLIQSGISKFISLFPDANFEQAKIDKYNEMISSEILDIRDFIILHYKISKRTDSAFWRYCKAMDIPLNLSKKIKLYESGGIIFRDNNELFDDVSWFSVMHGQGLKAKSYNPLIDEIDDDVFFQFMNDIKNVTLKSAEAMPKHEDYIFKNCRAL